LLRADKRDKSEHDRYPYENWNKLVGIEVYYVIQFHIAQKTGRGVGKGREQNPCLTHLISFSSLPLPLPALFHIKRYVIKNTRCESDQHLYHPWERNKQSEEDRDNLRNKGQGHLLQLRNRLKKAYRQSYDKTHQ